MLFVRRLLRSLAGMNEKVVIVSHSTKMLDLLGDFLKIEEYTFSRLDGSTPEAKRHSMVENFNSTHSLTSKFRYVCINQFNKFSLTVKMYFS